MKVCFVCSEYPPGPHGGIGTMTRVLARALVKAGHEVRVTGIYPTAYPAPDYEEDRGVRVWRLRDPSRRFSWLQARYRLYRQISRWARDGDTDLIDAPDWEAPTAFWPRLPVPVIVRLHGAASYFAVEQNRPVRKMTFIMERAALNRADYWCSVSRYTAEVTKSVFGLKSDPAAILYNPIDMPPATTPFSQRCWKRVVYTGTLTAKKGILSLVSAWTTVRRSCPEAELHIYGKDGREPGGGSMHAYLSTQLSDDVRDSVYFHGHVDRDHLLDVLSESRVAVFPSYSETFGIAPVEAMACGCATIYTRLSCGPEIVREGVDGLLIDPDRPDEIAGAIIRLLCDDKLAQRLGEAGRLRSQSCFSVDSVLGHNVEFYKACLGEFERQRRG